VHGERHHVGRERGGPRLPVRGDVGEDERPREHDHGDRPDEQRETARGRPEADREPVEEVGEEDEDSQQKPDRDLLPELVPLVRDQTARVDDDRERAERQGGPQACRVAMAPPLPQGNDGDRRVENEVDVSEELDCAAQRNLLLVSELRTVCG
jgi:hypothetical protein